MIDVRFSGIFFKHMPIDVDVVNDDYPCTFPNIYKILF